MLFNSYEFIFAFLPLVAVIYFLTIRYLGQEAAIAWMVLASLFFYGWWNPVYLLFICASIIVNYWAAYYIAKLKPSPRRHHAKFLLIIGITLNLAFLGYFKYVNFFIDNINLLLEKDIILENIVLPLAISFFTFQQIAFLVDAYYNITHEYKFTHYSLFVTFFPQLIAGPIVHHKEMLPQFGKNISRRKIFENIAVGTAIFAIGLFKKAVLADGIAQYSTPVFSTAETGEYISFFIAWGASLAYTFQLYFDFSGYCDMAIGAARIFGIKLPLNFYSPYKSTNIIEFWRRWHMTLSRFLRDYLYIPLGGNRKGATRRYTNLLVTMLLGGLWHGAGWTFIIWGGLHGIYLITNHAWCHFSFSFTHTRLWNIMAWGLTFICVVVGWVFFRAHSFDGAINILSSMLGMHGIAIPNAIAMHLGELQNWLSAIGITTYTGGGAVLMWNYLWIILCSFIALFLPNTHELFSRYTPTTDINIPHKKNTLLLTSKFTNLKWIPTYLWATIIGLILYLGILSLTQVSEFLYFQF